MRRGTTPTIRLTVSNLSDIEVANAVLTIKQKATVMDKEIGDMDIQGDMLEIVLTQEETLSLQAGQNAEMQLRVLSKNNKAYASQILTLPVERILKEGVIK